MKRRDIFAVIDFIAAYEQSQILPGRVDAFWKSPQAQGRTIFSCTALDLIVSVTRICWKLGRKLLSKAGCRETEMMHLADAETAEFARLRCETAKAMILSDAGWTGLDMFRLPEGEISYAEMVHPVDFQRDELEGDISGGGFALAASIIFRPLGERGDFALSRARGILPRYDDLRATAACYRSFAAAQPPLLTPDGDLKFPGTPINRARACRSGRFAVQSGRYGPARKIGAECPYVVL